MSNNLDIDFGRYRLIRMIGEGGMAQVYHAVMAGPMGFEKDCAIKVLKPGVDEGDRLVKALINEARLGGFLRHPNIVEIYEFNKHNDRYFLAMEFVDGPVYEDVVKHYRTKQEYMSVRSVLGAMVDALRGLHQAHTVTDRDKKSLNLIHRDMKPGNMMIEPSGVLKLMDFGIARADSNLYKTTSMNMTKGTPVYMSPEQVRGEDLDWRSDIWAIGAILYELITLRVLFKAPNLVAVMNRILTADIGDAPQVLDSFHDGLGEIFAKCMQQDRELRYETAAEARKAVEQLLATVPADQPGLEEVILPLQDEREKAIEEFTAKTAQMNSLTDAPIGGDAVVAGLAQASAQNADPAAATIAATATSGTNVPASTDAFFQSQPTQAAQAATMEMPGSTTGYEQPKKSSSLLLIGLLVIAVLGLGGGLIFVMGTQKGANDNQAAAAQADPVKPGNKAETKPETKPELVVENQAKTEPKTVKPEPKTVKPEPKTVKPEPKTVKVKPEPKTVKVKPEPKTVKVVNNPPPVIKEKPPSGSGTLQLNSRPWSEVYVDGKHVGSTPVSGYKVSAGTHKVTFDCTICDPPTKKVYNVKVDPNKNAKKIHRFN